jgi:hypothetical protein
MTTTKVNLANTVEGILPVANGGTGTSTGVAPGGSTTQVQYNNAGAFAGSANLVWDNSNVRLGIGTSSPGQKLHVAGTTGTTITSVGDDTLTQPYVYLSASADTGLGALYTRSNHAMWFGTNNTERMRIVSTGEVCIGTTTPAGAGLTVAGSSASIFLTDTNGTPQTWRILSKTSTTSQFRIYDQTQGVDRLVIDSSGNVGISTTSPGVRLDVAGTIRSSISGGTPIFYLNNGTTQHSIQNTSGALTFFNDGTERFRIGASGQWGIGGANYGSSGQVFTSNGSGSAPSWGSVSLPAGTVLQVVQTAKTDAFSMGTSDWTTITGFSAAITPSSTANKVLIRASIGCDASTGNAYIYRLLRNGSVPSGSVGNASGSRDQSIARKQRTADGNHSYAPAVMEFLDSPSSTSSVTYSIQVKAESNGTYYFNRTQNDTDTSNAFGARAMSSYTLMEVKG